MINGMTGFGAKSHNQQGEGIYMEEGIWKAKKRPTQIMKNKQTRNYRSLLIDIITETRIGKFIRNLRCYEKLQSPHFFRIRTWFKDHFPFRI